MFKSVSWVVPVMDSICLLGSCVRDVTTSTDHEKVFVTQKSAVHIHNKNNLNRQAHVQQ